MLILGIESTCDETGCAIVRGGSEILSNVISSQIDLHKEYGGVVPELACRRHVDVMIPVIDQALKEANLALSQIDLISVAQGPGLIGALLLGVNTAKALSLALNKPLLGINHIEAHLFAAIMSQNKEIEFPTLGVVLSGGHTSLVLMHSLGKYKVLGQTVDDAIGEAFDKVAKILDLPYPGGPEIEALAKEAKRTSDYVFKPGKVKERPLDFSFSGLKTAVLYAIHGQNLVERRKIPPEEKIEIAYAFQKAALTDVVEKTLIAARKYGCRTLIFGGGVTNNQRLREMFLETCGDYEYLWPSRGLSLDNAAMIAGLAYHKFLQIDSEGGKCDGLDMEAKTSISF